jgi:hypothetical protein
MEESGSCGFSAERGVVVFIELGPIIRSLNKTINSRLLRQERHPWKHANRVWVAGEVAGDEDRASWIELRSSMRNRHSQHRLENPEK